MHICKDDLIICVFFHDEAWDADLLAGSQYQLDSASLVSHRHLGFSSSVLGLRGI